MGSDTPVRVLVVEDDARVKNELEGAMKRAGFAVSTASSLAEAHLALADPVDLLLLDLGLPDGDGLTLCREVRSTGSSIPIVILTAREDSRDRVLGLDSGADDYVIKPFDIEELLARVRSVMRRTDSTGYTHKYQCGDLWLDSGARTAGRGSTEIELTVLEFELLHLLIRHPGRAWSREQILARVWRPRGWPGGPRTIDTHVRNLREKIEPEPSDPRYLMTRWGVGYALARPGMGAR